MAFPRAQSRDSELVATIRCVIAEDHVLLRQGLRRLLEDQPDIEVVAEAANGAETLQRVFEYKPDIVLAGPGVFGLAAAEAERLIRKESPQSVVLFVDGSENHSPIFNIQADGAKSAARNTSIEELVEMAKAYVQKTEVQTMPQRDHNEWVASEVLVPRNRDLTMRENEVLKLLAEGKTVRAAAQILGVSVKTVDAHKFNLMRKLGVHNKAELVMCAIQRKVIKIPVNF